MPIDFNVGAIASAEQAGGLLGPSPSHIPGAHRMIHGKELDHHHPGNHLPHSGAGVTGGVSNELSALKYGANSPWRDPEKEGSSGNESETTMR